MSKTWEDGSTRRWRLIRAEVLARDGYQCRAHNDGHCDRVRSRHTHRCTGYPANHAHHTRGRAITGDDPRFIVASCQACNLFIGSPERHEPPPKRVSRW